MGRTTIVLGVIAVVMAAFIIFFERDTITSRDLEERKGHLLQRFVRERVEKLEIERGGKKTVLIKEPGDAEGFEDSTWKLTQPWQAQADASTVDSLLGTIEWMDAKRTFENITQADRKRFGFEKPKIRAWYSIGSQRMPIVVGNQDPRGFGFYLQLDDPSQAYIVDKELFEALDRDPGEFYTKALHDGLSVFTTASVVIRDDEGEKAVEKRETDFWLTKPDLALASYDAVEDLIDGFDRMKASRFVSEKVADLSQYGLEAPILEALIRPSVSKEDEKKAEKKQPLRIRIGTKCGEQENESYILIGEQGPVMCVTDESLSAVRKAVGSLRERRLLGLREGEIEGVRIESGKRRLELDFDKSKWRYAAFIGKKDAVAKGEADTHAVEQWFEKLREFQMTASIPADDAVWQKRGIDEPQVVIRFIRSKKDREMIVRVGSVEGESVFVQRAGEPWATSFSASVLDWVTATSAHFRKRRLLDENSEELTELLVKRVGRPEKLEKKSEDNWRIIQPIKAEADRAIVEQLGSLFSKLEAVRFVADVPETSHGLDNPSITLTARYSKEPHDSSHDHQGRDKQKTASADRSYTLKIGGATDNGRFAQLGKDRAVFVISEMFVDLASQPLVTRTLVGFAKERIERVRIEKGSKAIEIHSRESGFEFLDNKGTKAEATQLVEHLVGLKASKAIAYGEPVAEEGIDRPRFRITVTRDAEEPATRTVYLLIGNSEKKDDGSAQLFLRRSDIPVSYSVTSEQLDGLIKLLR